MNDILKAMEIKKLLDNGKITSKEANRMVNNQFIILGGTHANNKRLGNV